MTSFPIRQAHGLVRDLMEHRPWIYFADFTVSAVIGYLAAGMYFAAMDFSPAQFLWFVIAGLALFRAGVFIHEIVHMPRGCMTAFKAFWNVSYGIPMLTPSFMYQNHADHHAKGSYGTRQDGEYQPFARGGMGRIIAYFAQVPALPLFSIFRFLVLAPLSLVHPSVRRWVLRRASSYISNPAYVRELPPHERRGWWVAAEIGCFCVVVAWAFAFLDDVIPWSIFFELYLLSVFAIGLNWTRNLAGHRFRSDGTPMSHEAQFLDSVTITGTPWITEILFPVGMRYHAVHHLFPGMPYHNLGEAHRRLLEKLPPESGYGSTLYSGFWSVMRHLRADMRAHREAKTTI